MTSRLKYESLKKEIRSIINSIRFSEKRLTELLQEVEKISPSDPRPVKKKMTMDQLTQVKLQKLINQ